ncbi:MAG: hypothetical protein EB127_08935 [Alphaproteobacteria bacterium]|nr:hypothetical protein [Alphaproteobacteria bacterium]
MINPRDFLSENSQQDTRNLIDMDGTFSCQENGCFEITTTGKFNESDRVITWVCSQGHAGRANL